MCVNDLENGILLQRENYSKPEVAFCCAHCGADICEGEDYYDVGGDKFCEDCVKHKTAGW